MSIVWNTEGWPNDNRIVILATDCGAGVTVVRFDDSGEGILPALVDDGYELEFDHDTKYPWAELPKLDGIPMGRWGDNPMREDENL